MADDLISKSIPFVDAIKLSATRPNLDYWTRDNDKPNLPLNVFTAAILLLPSDTQFKREPRKSEKGHHGKDGELHIFSAEFVVMF